MVVGLRFRRFDHHRWRVLNGRCCPETDGAPRHALGQQRIRVPTVYPYLGDPGATLYPRWPGVGSNQPSSNTACLSQNVSAWGGVRNPGADPGLDFGAGRCASAPAIPQSTQSVPKPRDIVLRQPPATTGVVLGMITWPIVQQEKQLARRFGRITVFLGCSFSRRPSSGLHLVKRFVAYKCER